MIGSLLYDLFREGKLLTEDAAEQGIRVGVDHVGLVLLVGHKPHVLQKERASVGPRRQL